MIDTVLLLRIAMVGTVARQVQIRSLPQSLLTSVSSGPGLAAIHTSQGIEVSPEEDRIVRDLRMAMIEDHQDMTGVVAVKLPLSVEMPCPWHLVCHLQSCRYRPRCSSPSTSRSSKPESPVMLSQQLPSQRLIPAGLPLHIKHITNQALPYRMHCPVLSVCTEKL